MGYATRILDMNDDGKPDILVVDTERVIWFENPSWQLHTIIEHAHEADNVSIAPADIDGDGQLDFALAADWRPGDTRTSGSLQWIRRGTSPDDPWTRPPDRHRADDPSHSLCRFGRRRPRRADRRAAVRPRHQRTATLPRRRCASSPIKIPADPVTGPWMPRVINEELHVAHNFWPTDLDRDGKLDMLVASFEGVSLLTRADDGTWQRTLIGSGNQETSPSRGASEIKHGRLAGGADYLATIEPWHGFQVVVYTPPEAGAANGGAGAMAPRFGRGTVLDEELKWGHAVWCADLDGDGDQELVIGVRDTKDSAHPVRPAHLRSGRRLGSSGDAGGPTWTKHVFDPAGVAIEDLAVGDLDGDGRTDVVAVGRQTHNVRIYWNETEAR